MREKQTKKKGRDRRKGGGKGMAMGFRIYIHICLRTKQNRIDVPGNRSHHFTVPKMLYIVGGSMFEYTE